ncbi:MAG: hypothetical protein QM572_05810 [Nocardioides sp.]|uniref:hypothetical protein n=1 Tax=Nocardioides sp. TaxID=35761 RepID=UPI0039E4D228
MAASTKHIATNVERMNDDVDLMKIWREVAVTGTPQEAWAKFIEAADEARIAHRIPGTVGRTFKAKYAKEPKPELAKDPAKKTTTRKAASTKAATA